MPSHGNPGNPGWALYASSRRVWASRALTGMLAAGLLAAPAVSASAASRSYYYVFSNEGLSGGRDGDCFRGDASIVRITGNKIYSVSIAGCDVFYDRGVISRGAIRWEGRCHDLSSGAVAKNPTNWRYSGRTPKGITAMWSLSGSNWREERVMGPKTTLASIDRWYARVSGNSRDDSATQWLNYGSRANWISPQC